MKKYLFSCLTLFIFIKTNLAYSYSLPQGAIDIGQLDELTQSGKLNDDQLMDVLDIVESGGDVLNYQQIPARDEMTEEEIFEKLNTPIETIPTTNSQNDKPKIDSQTIQSYSIKQTLGYGDWAFHFIFIDHKGNEKIISSLNSHFPTRPGSTLKLFTSWSAYKRQSYPIGSVDQKGSMTHMLRWSDNIEADNALKSVSKLYPKFALPPNHELMNLLGHKMRNGRKLITIDQLILKGCALIKNDFTDLVDSTHFYQVNGSGLQDQERDSMPHQNKVTAQLEVSLLKKILQSGKYNEFKKMLPSPGAKGSLEPYFTTKEFQQLRKNSIMFAKTGTLGNAKSLAGYVELPQGKIVFSILSDNLKGLSPRGAMTGPIENIVAKNIEFIIKNL